MTTAENICEEMRLLTEAKAILEEANQKLTTIRFSEWMHSTAAQPLAYEQLDNWEAIRQAWVDNSRNLSKVNERLKQLAG